VAPKDRVCEKKMSDKSKEELSLELDALKDKYAVLKATYEKDITEGRLSDDFLRLVVNNIPDFVFWKDRNSVYLGCNNVFAKAAGVGVPEGIVGKTDYQLSWKKEESDFFVAVDRRVMESGQAEYHIIEPQLQAGGKQSWIETCKVPLYDEHRQVVGVLGTYMDITNRMQAEVALMESERRYRLIAENSSDVIWTMNLAGEFTYISPTTVRLRGFTADEVMHQPLDKQIAPGSLPIALALLKKLFENARQGLIGPPEVVELEQLRKDGSTVWTEASVELVKNGVDGSLILLGVTRDTTERKLAEADQLRLESQVLKAQKLESLGLLAGGIAHDFNNLLMVILGSAELANCDVLADSSIKPRIEDIITVAKRASELCNQMLAYAGKARFVIESTNLADVIWDMTPILKVAVSKNAHLHFKVSNDVPVIEADRTQLRQIIMNLVINASEAQGERVGDIVITTGVCIDCDLKYCQDPELHGTLSAGPHVFLEVSDTGCGITDDAMRRIFDPFFTTKFTGHGLGLAAVLGIVRAHKGALRVRSIVGKGTTFTALFPVSGLNTVSVLPKQVAPQVNVLRAGVVVLLVDDDEDVVVIARLLLEKLGCEVLVAACGRQSVELYREHRSRVDCVLLDLTMPEMDGDQTLTELKKIDPDACVILSSGYSEHSVAPRFVDRGIAGFVHKPYQLATLRAVLEKSLRCGQAAAAK